jgi:hypothetical protein
MISFPAPSMCQGADEDLMIQLGAIIFPECLKRWLGETGFRIWVDGSSAVRDSRSEAVTRFQIVLGVLRAWRPDAGELQDERRAGLGEGSIRDQAGNQTIMLGTAIEWTTPGGEVERFGVNARRAVDQSQPLRDALWLNGRANRTAADYYMIHEYAKQGLRGETGISQTTGISVRDQNRLKRSANNLSPLEGGRHAKKGETGLMRLGEQRELVSTLLRRWIGTLAELAEAH